MDIGRRIAVMGMVSLLWLSGILPVSPALFAQAEGLPPASLTQMQEALPTEKPETPTSSLSAVQDMLEHDAQADKAGEEILLGEQTCIRILLIGTDSYTSASSGRSDTMIVAQLDTQRKQIKMISFLRDLYVAIPGYRKTRLNAAYVYGGADLLVDTLENNFGVTVDGWVAVNFSRMVEVIDRLGGVTVEVSEQERKQLNSILKYYNTQNGYPKMDEVLEVSGSQRLTGKQALCFSRIRKIDSDFTRVSRQRKVMEAIYVRIREMDAITLMSILTQAYGDVKTNLTMADAASLIPVLFSLRKVTWDSLTIPVSDGYKSTRVSGMDVLVPNLKTNQLAISRFLQ